MKVQKTNVVANILDFQILDQDQVVYAYRHRRPKKNLKLVFWSNYVVRFIGCPARGRGGFSEISSSLFSGSGLSNTSLFPLSRSQILFLPSGSFAISVPKCLLPFFLSPHFPMFLFQVCNKKLDGVPIGQFAWQNCNIFNVIVLL